MSNEWFNNRIVSAMEITVVRMQGKVTSVYHTPSKRVRQLYSRKGRSRPLCSQASEMGGVLCKLHVVDLGSASTTERRLNQVTSHTITMISHGENSLSILPFV